MSYKIIDIDPLNSPLELLYRYLDFAYNVHLEQNPKDPISNKDKRLQQLRDKVEGQKRIHHIVIKEETQEVIAAIRLEYLTDKSNDFEKNKHILGVELSFLDEYGENVILQELVSKCGRLKKEIVHLTTIETWSTLERVWKFWENLGATYAHEELIIRLYLDEVDWNLMKQWLAKGHRISEEEGIELIQFQRCPDELIEKYVTLQNEILHLHPSGDSSWEESKKSIESIRKVEQSREANGYDWQVIVSMEKNGELSGMTEIFFYPPTPFWIMQMYTAVIPKYQSRGVGKWLKAEMIHYINKNLPETLFLVTGNAEYNAPIQSINKRMGYKTHQIEKLYKIAIEDLSKNL